MTQLSGTFSATAGQLIELSPVRTRNSTSSDKDPGKEKEVGSWSNNPQPPMIRPRRKLPWLVARDMCIEERKAEDEKRRFLDSHFVTGPPIAELGTADQSTAEAYTTRSYNLPFQELERDSDEDTDQEQKHPLLEPDENEWASHVIARLDEEATRTPSPGPVSSHSETREGAPYPLNGRRLFGQLGRISPRSLEDVPLRYSTLRSSEGSTITPSGQSAVTRKRRPTVRFSSVSQTDKKDSQAFKSALDGLEELMNEALRMAEHGLSPEENNCQSPSNSDRLARTAFITERSADGTGPLPISSSSSSNRFKDRAIPSSGLGRWWSRPESRHDVDTPPLSPLEKPKSKGDENYQSSEDTAILQENPSHRPASPSFRTAYTRMPLDKLGDSKAIDWAYVPQSTHPKQVPSSSGSSDSNQSVLRRPIPVHGPTAPISTLPPNREQFNYLDRKPIDEDPQGNPKRFYNALELHRPHFVEGRGRGRRRRGFHQLNPRPRYSDEDELWQHKDHKQTPRHHVVEHLEPALPHSSDPVRRQEGSRQNSSIGSEPADGKLGLGEVDIEKLNLKEPRRSHHSLLEHQPVSLGRHHRRQPVARDWHTTRKRLTATVACMNTALLGLIIGIYAGEVPSIQYYLADQTHTVILGNVVLYLGMALTTLLSWPLPLLHGRRRYLLTAISLAVPLQFPQALAVQSYRSPTTPAFRAALLVPRALLGLALGVANVNCIAVLLDLFGASLQSKVPHQEIVTGFDLRRHGGGLGLWLGWWTWCSIGSLAVGFWVGASIIETMNPAWGFYVVVVLAAGFLLLNVLCPETRRARFRRTVGEFVTEEEEVRRWVARGEVKLHVYQVGPKWWFEELVAGLVLMKRMLNQTGFLVVAVFTAWIYAQIVLVIVLLGALLSRAYVLKASYVGLGVFAIAIGAFLAIPLSKANILSRSRKKGQRTDSMTFEHDVTWSSHMVRRLVFTTILPIAGIAYTIVSVVRKMHWIGPIIFAGFIGFFSNLAIAECNGLIMETFDTSDLQPGVNSKHRLQSLAVDVRRRRTNYSSYPRISAGIFATQGLSFLFAAGATGIGGKATRELGAPLTTGIWAAILMGLTVLLALVLWRFKSVRVIPGQAFGTRAGTRTSTAWGASAEDDWKPVVVGNPSGKMRRMNLLELGRLSRWVEIRRLNKLQKD